MVKGKWFGRDGIARGWERGWLGVRESGGKVARVREGCWQGFGASGDGRG